MHKLTRTCTVLLLAAIVAAPAAHGACRALFADGPELWITNADGDATRLLREERDVAMARFSPDRERIAYVRGFDLTGEVMSHIVVMRPGSEETVEIPIRAELGITDGLLRLSVGLEDVDDDGWADLPGTGAPSYGRACSGTMAVAARCCLRSAAWRRTAKVVPRPERRRRRDVEQDRGERLAHDHARPHRARRRGSPRSRPRGRRAASSHPSRRT